MAAENANAVLTEIASVTNDGIHEAEMGAEKSVFIPEEVLLLRVEFIEKKVKSGAVIASFDLFASGFVFEDEVVVGKDFLDVVESHGTTLNGIGMVGEVHGEAIEPSGIRKKILDGELAAEGFGDGAGKFERINVIVASDTEIEIVDFFKVVGTRSRAGVEPAINGSKRYTEFVGKGFLRPAGVLEDLTKFSRYIHEMIIGNVIMFVNML